MPEINYIAILMAAVAAMVIGGIWYGPIFGKIWAQGMGWDPDNADQMAKVKKSAGPAYGQQFLGALLMAFVLAHVLWAFGEALPNMTGPTAALQGAFWTWLGFILPVKYGEKLWGGKEFKYVAIDLGYYLILLVAMSLILASW